MYRDHDRIVNLIYFRDTIVLRNQNVSMHMEVIQKPLERG